MLLVLVVVLLVGLGGLYVKNSFNFGTQTFQRETVEVEKEVVVDALEKKIKDALDQKESFIRESGDKAKQAEETRIKEAIELEVREAYGKELDAKALELKKKQASY